MGLLLNIGCDSRFEVDGEVILKDRNLRDQAFDQRLVKLREVSTGTVLIDTLSLPRYSNSRVKSEAKA